MSKFFGGFAELALTKRNDLQTIAAEKRNPLKKLEKIAPRKRVVHVPVYLITADSVELAPSERRTISVVQHPCEYDVSEHPTSAAQETNCHRNKRDTVLKLRHEPPSATPPIFHTASIATLRATRSSICSVFSPTTAEKLSTLGVLVPRLYYRCRCRRRYHCRRLPRARRGKDLHTSLLSLPALLLRGKAARRGGIHPICLSPQTILVLTYASLLRRSRRLLDTRRRSLQ